MNTPLADDKVIEVTDADYARARRYSYEIWWSDRDNVWIGRVEELPGVKSHGDSPDAALAETTDAAALMLAAMRDWQETIPPPLEDRQPVTVHDLTFERPPVPTAQDVRAIS